MKFDIDKILQEIDTGSIKTLEDLNLTGDFKAFLLEEQQAAEFIPDRRRGRRAYTNVIVQGDTHIAETRRRGLSPNQVFQAVSEAITRTGTSRRTDSETRARRLDTQARTEYTSNGDQVIRTTTFRTGSERRTSRIRAENGMSLLDYCDHLLETSEVYHPENRKQEIITKLAFLYVCKGRDEEYARDKANIVWREAQKRRLLNGNLRFE